MTSNAASITAIDGGLEILLPLAPVPASRPKVSKWGVYYSKNHANFKREAVAMLRAVLRRGATLHDGVYVWIDAVKEKPKTSKKDWPTGDWDNFAKLVCDCITTAGICPVTKTLLPGAIWRDDDQVITGTCNKRWTLPGEKAHVRVRICDTMGGLWLGEPVTHGDDVYDLPEFMREVL